MQTSYNIYQAANKLGAIADSRYHDVVSRAASGAIPIGRAVVKATGSDVAVRLPTAGDTKIHGVALITDSMVADRTTGVVAYADKDTVDVARSSAVVVYTEQDVTSDDPVFVRIVAHGTGLDVGQFRKDADTVSSADTAIAWTAARFVNSASAGGLVVVEFNLP